MKIFTGEVPVNPYVTNSESRNETTRHFEYYEGQLSILNQCVEVDLDEMHSEWEIYRAKQLLDIRSHDLKNDELFNALNGIMPFSQFLQAQKTQQENKDGSK
jgi:hypothetical protein